MVFATPLIKAAAVQRYSALPTDATKRMRCRRLVYSNLPYPENRLVALAHSLLVRGVIDEAELEERLAAVRARLES